MTDQRALVAVAVQFFLNGAVFSSFLPRLPEIRDRVGVSIGGLGAMLSVAGLAGIAGSAVVGPAIRRFGTRRVVVLAGTVLSLSLPLIGFARTIGLLFVGLLLMLSLDVLVDVAMNMQGSWLSARRHTPVMNRLHGLWSVGTVVGGLSASRIADAGISLPAHLLAASAFLLIMLFAVASRLLKVDEHPVDPTATNTETGRARRLSPMLLLFAAAGLFAVALEHTSMSWATFRFTEDFGASAGFAALGYVAVTMGMTTGRLGGDWLLTRFGPHRLLRLAVAASGAGALAATIPHLRYLNLLGFGLVGIGAATMLPRLYDQAAKHGELPGAGLAALTSGIRIGIVLSPIIVGELADTALSVGAAIAIVIIPATIGFLAVATAVDRT